MKLISEEIQDAEYLVEETNGKKNYKIRGVFLQSDIKNRNGRIYENDILSKEVDRYSKEFINKNGEFTVNIALIAHMITALTPDGKNFMGEAKIMDTPYGKIVKGLIDEGAQLGVSSRGMGSLVTKGGANYVGKDFYLATAADIVADPSAPDAFVEGIMESKEWVWDNGVIKAKDIEEYREYIQRAKSIKLAEAKANVFKNFLEKL